MDTKHKRCSRITRGTWRFRALSAQSDLLRSTRERSMEENVRRTSIQKMAKVGRVRWTEHVVRMPENSSQRWCLLIRLVPSEEASSERVCWNRWGKTCEESGKHEVGRKQLWTVFTGKMLWESLLFGSSSVTFFSSAVFNKSSNCKFSSVSFF